MTISIPVGRTIDLETKPGGGGFQSVGLPDGSPPGALTMGTPTKTSSSITGVVIDGNGSTSYEHRADSGTITATLTATGLSAETLYSMEWRGVNEFGEGPWTTPVNVTTDAAGSGVISGTGFGSGPDVVLFSSADGTSGELVALTDPEIGDYTELEVKAFEHAPGVRYHTKNSKTWITGRDPLQLSSTSKLMTGVRFALDTPSDRFRVAFKLAAADGQKMPGAASVGGSPSDNGGSVFKTIWVDYLNGFGNSNPDTCIPTWIPFPKVAGNDVRPEYNDGGAFSDPTFSSSSFDFGAGENLISYVSGSPESSVGAYDGMFSWLLAVQGTSSSFTHTRRTDAQPFHNDTAPYAPEDKLWQDFCFPGWYGNTSFVDVLPLYRDMYIAVGNNCEACIILSDAATLAASTEFALVPPTTWTDTEITYNPRAYDPAFRHIYLADGTLMENV